MGGTTSGFLFLVQCFLMEARVVPSTNWSIGFSTEGKSCCLLQTFALGRGGGVVKTNAHCHHVNRKQVHLGILEDR